MKRHQKYIAYVFLSFLLLFGASLATLYSSWGQNKIRSWILSALAKEGFHAEIESFEGFLVPNQITLQKVRMDLPEGGSLSIEHVKASLFLLYFLKNEIHLKEAVVSGAVWKSPKSSDASLSLSLPMSFSIKSLKATNVRIDQMEPIDLNGSVRLEAHQKGLFLDIKALHGQDQATLWLKKRKSGFTRWSIDLQIADSSWLQPLYNVALQGSLELHAKGTDRPIKGTQGFFEGKAKMQNGPEALQIPWVFKGQLQHAPDSNWSLSNIHIEGKDVDARANVSLDNQGRLIETSGQMQSAKLFIPSLKGNLLARWMLRREAEDLVGKTVVQIPHLQAGSFELEQIELIAESINEQGSFELKGPDWQTKGEFAWTDRFQLNNFHLEAPQLKGQGSWEFFYDGSVKGNSELTIDNLQILKPLAPELNPYGQLQLKIIWDQKQVSLDMMAKHLYLKSFYFEQAALYSDLNDPLNQLTGLISIDVEKGSYRGLRLDSALIETAVGGNERPFKLFAEGVWNRDFEVHSEGFWHLADDEITGQVNDFHGLFYSHPFSLKESVHLLFSPKKTEITPTYIEMDEATVKGQWLKEEDSSSFSLRLTEFPIDCLSINPLEVSITGKLDFEAEGKEKNQQLEGNFQAAVSQVEITRLGETDSITAQGNLAGQFKNDQLVLQGDLSTREQPLASLNLKVPMHLTFTPWRADFLDDKPTEGQFHLDGQIEDFLDFFNLRSHWLQGRSLSTFSWSGTLRNPVVEGSFQLTDGYYENYLTGTQLTDLQIDLVAEKGVLQLKSLTAKDQEQTGSLFADGSIQLDKKFPFHFHLAFQNFHFVQLGFVSANANSAIDIEGNLERALAKGEVHIIHSNLTIPENLSKSPPNLEVVYLNAEKPLPAPPPSPAKNYPLLLDLTIDTPQPVLISGRGLESEWKGNFILKGTHSEPQPVGTLELMDGKFSFSGRFFKLTRGSLTFSSQNLLTPHLDLSGTTEQQGIAIIVSLEGPLNNPQLTFQSVPPLPLSAIIAHLLFGEDISEINGLQALQLATAVANISGQSPDVLESTRRSLGIDRLRIVSEPTSEGEETISIQVGKYVAKGVLVSISQNAEDSAPNITIEVDIGKGFFFLAETDQLQEQGKFGLKWNRNY